MIPTLGLMIWAYCTARLLEIGTRDSGKVARVFVGIAIALALIVLAYGCIDLHLRGTATPGMP